MAMRTKAPVAEKTAVIEMVEMVTRVYVGLAIGLGFVASAMAVYMIPDNWGAGKNAAPKVSPLLVSQVVDVKSLVNWGEDFVPVNYYAGNQLVYAQTWALQGTVREPAPTTNQPLKIIRGQVDNGNTNSGITPTSFSIESVGGGTPTSFSIESVGGGTPTSFSIESVGGSSPTSFSIESVGGPTSYSIEPIPSAGLPTQMLVLSYRLVGDAPATDPRLLTVCLGRTTANTVYIAPDGSTYVNSVFGALLNRTTDQPCSTIKSRALKIGQTTGGTLVQEAGDYPSTQLNFIRAFVDVARFSAGIYEVGNGQPVTLPTEAPLYGGVVHSSDPTKPTAPSFVTLTDATRTLTLCLPSSMPDALGGPVFYFDTNGTPYTNLLLSTRALTAACPSITAKSLKYGSLTAGTTFTLDGSMAKNVQVEFSRTNRLLGQFASGVFTGSGVTIPQMTSLDPLLVKPAVTAPTIGTTSTTPSMIGQLRGSIGSQTEVQTAICVPSMTYLPGGTDVNSSSAVLWAYYDSAGNPYQDLFLTKRLACSTSGTTGGKQENVK